MTYEETLSDSRQRAVTGKANLTYLKPLRASRAALRRAVEEADWLGDEERSWNARQELVQVEAAIGRGETYQPEW